MKLRTTCCAPFVVLMLLGGANAQPDEDQAYVITQPERRIEEVDQLYAKILPVSYRPPEDRWERLARVREKLAGQGEEFRVVMLGDSIVNDTSRSCWDVVLGRSVPGCKITKVTCVRGSTGCWWYKEPGRVQKYVLGFQPDLLIIGGISQRDDIDSIREVIKQVRAESKCDILLMTGAFGSVDPRNDAQWSLAIPEGSYRAGLKDLASEQSVAFLDMSALWGEYIRASDRELGAFKRDPVHANGEGEQILGRILAAHLALDPAKVLGRP